MTSLAIAPSTREWEPTLHCVISSAVAKKDNHPFLSGKDGCKAQLWGSGFKKCQLW
jgi:hypothetical protein